LEILWPQSITVARKKGTRIIFSGRTFVQTKVLLKLARRTFLSGVCRIKRSDRGNIWWGWIELFHSDDWVGL
jgi:hypothetical protein